MQPATKHNGWWPAIAAALAVHIGLIGLLAWRTSWTPTEKADTGADAETEPVLPIELKHVEEVPGQSPRIDERELAQEMDRQIDRLEKVSDEQKFSTLQRHTDWIESNSDVESIREIAGIVRRVVDAPHRAYAPSATPPPGSFDSASMLPYASRQIAGPDGIERTVQTWVDKDGRTMKQTVRRSSGADGRIIVHRGVYMPDGSLFETEYEDDGELRVFDKAMHLVAESPLLSKLVSDALLPVLESRRRSSSTAPP